MSAADGIREGFHNMHKRTWHGRQWSASKREWEGFQNNLSGDQALSAIMEHTYLRAADRWKEKKFHWNRKCTYIYIHTTTHSHHSFSSPGRKETTFEETHFSPLSSCQTCSINRHLVWHQSISRSLFSPKCVGQYHCPCPTHIFKLFIKVTSLSMVQRGLSCPGGQSTK